MSSRDATCQRPGCWLTAAGVALVLALAPIPAAHADPGASDDASPPVGAEQLPPAPENTPAVDDAANPAAADACRQFGVALNYAASNYEDFAYNSAGSGNYVDYADPIVANSNVIGRTALREAAATAWNASMTPGLQADIASPMQSWSLRATKLLLSMGLRSGGDSLNSTANALNSDARDVQMACALAGSRA
jgi:hypothetical protein